jgi:hypothetical protein
MSGERVVIRRSEVTDLSKSRDRRAGNVAGRLAGIIPDEVQRQLLDRWYSRESLSRALAAQGSSFFVAESNGDVIGFAQFVRRSAESVS